MAISLGIDPTFSDKPIYPRACQKKPAAAPEFSASLSLRPLLHWWASYLQMASPKWHFALPRGKGCSWLLSSWNSRFSYGFPMDGNLELFLLVFHVGPSMKRACLWDQPGVLPVASQPTTYVAGSCSVFPLDQFWDLWIYGRLHIIVCENIYIYIIKLWIFMNAVANDH